MVWYDPKKLVLPYISGDFQGNVAEKLYDYIHRIRRKNEILKK